MAKNVKDQTKAVLEVEEVGKWLAGYLFAYTLASGEIMKRQIQNDNHLSAYIWKCFIDFIIDVKGVTINYEIPPLVICPIEVVQSVIAEWRILYDLNESDPVGPDSYTKFKDFIARSLDGVIKNSKYIRIL